MSAARVVVDGGRWTETSVRRMVDGVSLCPARLIVWLIKCN